MKKIIAIVILLFVLLFTVGYNSELHEEITSLKESNSAITMELDQYKKWYENQCEDLDKALRNHGEYERIIEELKVELLLHEKVKGDVKITFTAMVREMTYDYCATPYKTVAVVTPFQSTPICVPLSGLYEEIEVGKIYVFEALAENVFIPTDEADNVLLGTDAYQKYPAHVVSFREADVEYEWGLASPNRVEYIERTEQ